MTLVPIEEGDVGSIVGLLDKIIEYEASSGEVIADLEEIRGRLITAAKKAGVKVTTL